MKDSGMTVSRRIFMICVFQNDIKMDGSSTGIFGISLRLVKRPCTSTFVVSEYLFSVWND